MNFSQRMGISPLSKNLQLDSIDNDSSGIRHALMDESTCDFDDAKFMLVSSSAFINYLISKAQKAGIEIK